MFRLEPEENVLSADCQLCVNGTAADCEPNGGPSRFECQPYWLSLITPHSTFVYGGNESLTKRGIPHGEASPHEQRGGFTSGGREEAFLVNRFVEWKRQRSFMCE